jgi:uncharacterized Zn-finger protein
MYDRDFDEEPRSTPSVPLSHKRFYEFDCPNCDANNPMNDGFRHGDEVICLYCGLEFKVQTISEDKFKLIPI